MPRIKSMIDRMIALRQEGVELTLLAVCPNSDAVLQAAVQAAARNNAPMLFAATFNQVDRDGGYTGWTPAAFVAEMRRYAAEYGCHDALFPGLAHGGQWLKDAHTRDRLTFEQTTAEVKASITSMLQAGYALLHIDPTVDREKTDPLPVEVVVTRTLDLIAYTEAERGRLGLSPISYEVGTEEVHGGVVELASFKALLSQLRHGLEERGLTHAWPAFVVAQVGTDLHSTRFDKQAATAATEIVAPYGSLIKGHYADWVTNPEEYPSTGIGGADIGPEFTACEYDALMALEQRERDLARVDSGVQLSNFSPTITAAVDSSNRWCKWLNPDERGKALDEVAPDRRDWLLRTSARYVWTDPQVASARQRLYDNLRPIMGDPHRFVVDWITRAIERYVVAFHMFDSRKYFE